MSIMIMITRQRYSNFDVTYICGHQHQFITILQQNNGNAIEMRFVHNNNCLVLVAQLSQQQNS